MKFFVRTDSHVSLVFNTLKEAEKCFEDWKEDYRSEGASMDDSFVEIHEFDNDVEESRVIKRVEPIVDEELTKEIGSPQENGCEWTYWARWQEVNC